MLFWRARISEFSAVWSPSRPLPGNRAPAFAARDPEALMLDAGFMRSLWGPVETDYRRAVAAAPGDAEARLHLGYVLLLLRRYPEARAELETASKAPNDRDVSYLGHLFLGRLCEAQRDLDAAASAYERALDVEPRAQSGLVALSLLEDMRGNRGRARSLIAAFATQPARQANDPWWSYHGSRVSSADLEWLRGRVRP
jgi:tetratricopeptide (TPR) repeat protein